MMTYDKVYVDAMKLLKERYTYTMTFKIGDSVKYKGLNITGKITDRDQVSHLWIINNSILASDEDLILDLGDGSVPDRPRKQCTCGSTSVGSDRHSSWCDS